LSDDYEFQQLLTPQTFTHQNLPNYGAFDWSAATMQQQAGDVLIPINLPMDFKYMATNTLWDTTNRRRVFGPLTIQDWQQLLIFNVNQAVFSYIMTGQVLRIYPTSSIYSAQTAGQPFAAGSTFTVYYGSCFGVNDSLAPLGITRTYETDTATCRLPSNLVLADVKWRWQRAKGLSYAEDKDIATRMCLNEVGRVDQGPIDMAGESRDAFPSLFVPTFNSVGHP
jgi:hypothetical protein